MQHVRSKGGDDEVCSGHRENGLFDRLLGLFDVFVLLRATMTDRLGDHNGHMDEEQTICMPVAVI